MIEERGKYLHKAAFVTMVKNGVIIRLPLTKGEI